MAALVEWHRRAGRRETSSADNPKAKNPILKLRLGFSGASWQDPVLEPALKAIKQPVRR